MFITPMEKIASLEGLKQAERNSAVSAGEGQGFQNIFATMIQNTRDTDASLTQQQYLLSTGQIDDAHTVPIESQKAQLSLEFLIQLRNKALDSYNELLRINL